MSFTPRDAYLRVELALTKQEQVSEYPQHAHRPYTYTCKVLYCICIAATCHSARHQPLRAHKRTDALAVHPHSLLI
jgi:hypothetical protein